MPERFMMFDHIAGMAYGWQAWPAKWGWEWSAFGPHGTRRGSTSSKEAAEVNAKAAVEQLKRRDELPGGKS